MAQTAEITDDHPLSVRSISFEERLMSEGDAFSAGGTSSVSPAAAAAFTASIAGNVMTVTAVASGALAQGVVVRDLAGLVANGTSILSLGTGTGGTGTYNLTGPDQTIASTSMTAAALSINSNVAGSSVIPQVGRVALIEEINVSADHGFNGQVLITADAGGAGRFPNYLQPLTIPRGGGAQKFKMGRALRGFQISSNSSVGFAIRQVLEGVPGREIIRGSVAVSGHYITDDWDFGAPVTIVVFGDSKLGTGPTKTPAMWSMRLKKYLASIGVRARIVLKGLSGSNTSEHIAFQEAGWYDLPQVSLGIMALGANDGAQLRTGAAVVADVATLWANFHARYPGKPFLVLGPSPQENNAAEAACVAIRDAEAAYVAGENNPLLKFAPQGAMTGNAAAPYDRTVASNFAASDTAGARIHPSDAGNAGEANMLIAAWPSLGITF